MCPIYSTWSPAQHPEIDQHLVDDVEGKNDSPNSSASRVECGDKRRQVENVYIYITLLKRTKLLRSSRQYDLDNDKMSKAKHYGTVVNRPRFIQATAKQFHPSSGAKNRHSCNIGLHEKWAIGVGHPLGVMHDAKARPRGQKPKHFAVQGDRWKSRRNNNHG
ncbi:hypothetical protein K488DRAFT_74862 [Vararia minispora EC-137]|uniref:Uncharacterized protein n=1 Tax=Vararia minispora EC-137 TaxID=1314806 RepID=A0ACB8Q5V0_9AGAM|nr:hypothetical protein K488DRAFT_74862 [Vararia minispora EC-137]